MTFSMCSKKTIPAGFSIIEVIIALAIFAMAGIAVWTLAANSLKTARLGRQELVAANLAQEGIEIVRSMRDSNWLRTAAGSRDNDNGANCAPSPPQSWRDRLCDGDYRAQYDNPNLLAPGSNPALEIDGNRFYQYSSGIDTPFRRRIRISTPPPPNDSISFRVESIVTWCSSGLASCPGNEREVVAEDVLWNWFGTTITPAYLIAITGSVWIASWAVKKYIFKG